MNDDPNMPLILLGVFATLGVIVFCLAWLGQKLPIEIGIGCLVVGVFMTILGAMTMMLK